jgi:hypothetical protein
MTKLTGPIPGSLTALAKVPVTDFQLHGSGGLCRLDPSSTTVTTTKCGTACPYPTCSCKWAVCQSGAAYNVPAAVAEVMNPTSPFYPLDAACCAAAGFTLRERLVLEGHLDCSVGRPCAVTPQGLTAQTVYYTWQNTPGGPRLLTGTIPPQLGGMTAIERLFLSSNQYMDGTLPPELGLLTAMTYLSLSSNTNLSGTIPPELGGLTAMTYLFLYFNLNLSGTIPPELGALIDLRWL